MTASSLLETLAARGIVLRVSGDKLRFHPSELLSAEELLAVREHKAALIELVQNSKPTTSKGMDALACIAPPAAKPVCPCGSTEWGDVPIHDGRSVRRDCARCG